MEAIVFAIVELLRPVIALLVKGVFTVIVLLVKGVFYGVVLLLAVPVLFVRFLLKKMNEGTSEATEAVSAATTVLTDRPYGLEAVAQDGAIVVTWEEPEITRSSVVADIYRILRHRPELGEPEPLEYVDFTDTSATSSYTDTGVEPGVMYVYRVQPLINFFGDLGEASDPVVVRMPAGETSQQEAPSENTPAAGSPTIDGTAQVGETLTTDTSGISDADGLVNASFTYQWLADDAPIAGAANNTYVLTDSEAGKAIKVRVSFTDDAGNSEELESAATAAVAVRR